MEKEQGNNVVKIRILELEDKLIYLIKLSVRYENIPVPVFEHEMDVILKEIEYLEQLL